MSAPVKDRHRELANEVYSNVFYGHNLRNGQEGLAEIIADAEARGYEKGVRDSASECSIFDTPGLTDVILSLLPEVTK